MFGDNIPIFERDRIRQFVEVFLPRCTDLAVTVPERMRLGEVLADGWWRWRAVESPVTEEDIVDFETLYDVSLPTLFQAYLQYRCLLNTEFFVVLPETPCDAPLDQLRSLLAMGRDDSRYSSNGWVPFARDPEGRGAICFTDGGKGTPRIVRVERDKGGALKPILIAQSFDDLLHQIEQDLKSYDP